jgi:hypothetical protein
MVKHNTIKKAVVVAIRATRFRDPELAFSVRLMKIGMFATGFMMAKNPAKTFSEKYQISCMVDLAN